MRAIVVAFEKHPKADVDFTQAVAGETVGILLELICECLTCKKKDEEEKHGGSSPSWPT